MSRFDDLLKSARGKEPGPKVPPPKSAPAPNVAPNDHADGVTVNTPATPLPRRMGRPPGKKSDPAFEQVTAYVPRDVYGSVRSALWNHHGRKEFSALVTELLAEWLDRQPSR